MAGELLRWAREDAGYSKAVGAQPDDLTLPTNPIAGTVAQWEDAIYSFKLAGVLLIAIVIALCLFGQLLRALPLGPSFVAFAFLLVVLHVVLDFYHWIKASHLSEDTQTTLKYIILGVIFVLLLALVI